MSESINPRVSLFVTCLADLMRPSVAFASIRLLEQAGCIVDVPLQQTCCGQPGYNSGEYEATIPIARQTIELFEHAEYVVAPSGSCAGMICHHYPKLLDGEWRERALALAEKTFELTSFLVDVVKLESAPAVSTDLPPITYHDSCAGLREMGVKDQPRQLLKTLCDVEINEMQQSDVCCGFGGTFCAKMPDISEKMVDDKLRNAGNSGATLLTGGDLGCLLNIAGRARRQGLELEVRHVAEILSGDLYSPAIGEGD
ncbi:(Fe-S)-binding protein [Pseudohalioglobus lutimaris]|uniref:(Fe-S)-binding protein n=1 Tax=Pseudohalioglobus lutimaris TaxID=1737061 RepID=A0A2N5X5H0_9GAMM|nr:(Fe-S)-binding protein [Pseudohalioglobus lutimaris]PLW69736.1 (Fe-S)-binding protein [Pseudohalioglobus lutimaris]